MTFSLSTRSLGRLEGVHPAIADTVNGDQAHENRFQRDVWFKNR